MSRVKGVRCPQFERRESLSAVTGENYAQEPVSLSVSGAVYLFNLALLI